MPDDRSTLYATRIFRTSAFEAPPAAHVVPFVAWLVLLFGLEYIGPAGAWKYAVRTATGLGLLLLLRPWRWYGGLRLRHVGMAVVAGVLVFVIWVGPEVRDGAGNPHGMVQELYLRFGVMPLGSLPPTPTTSVYAPATCGWPLTLVRLFGSAVVIAIIEEFFWRAFLYRRLLHRNFLNIDLGEFDLETFVIVCLLFGLEHDRWLAGAVAGAVYGYLMIRTRDVWAAALAHGITNFLLGIYVLRTHSYGFW